MAATQASVDKLLIINKTGEGLMARLHMLRNFKLTDELMSNNEEVFARVDKVFRDYDKDFDRIKGAQAYLLKATDIRAHLEEYYLTFVDVLNWRNTALDLLVAIDQENREFKFKDSGIIMSEYMALYVRYIQFHYLVCSVKGRRGFLVYFVKAHNLHGNSEPHFNRLCDFVNDYDTPHLIKKLREDLAPTRGRIGSILQDVQQYIMKWQGVQMIHAKGIFNIVDNPSKMRYEHQEPELLQLESLRSFQLWTIFGYLFAPECIAAAEGMAEMCTTTLNLCLKDSFVVPLFRDMSLNVHEEFKILFSSFTCAWPPNQAKKKFKLWASKFKKPYDLAANDPDATYTERTAFRTLLCGEMETMLNCFDAFPHTIAPKLSMINAALVLARWELETYFRLGSTPSHKARKGWQLKKDPLIPALIHHLQELRKRVNVTHNEGVTDYYRSYLANADFQELTSLQGNFKRDVPTAPKDVMGLWDRVVEDCKNAESIKDFSSLRLNGCRLLLSLTLNTGGANSQVASATCPALTRVIGHAKRIDGTKLSSLGKLCYFPELLSEVLQSCLTPEKFGIPSVGQSNYVISVVKVLADGVDNTNTLCPEEEVSLGEQSHTQAEKFMAMIVTAINDRVNMKTYGMFEENRRLSRLAGSTGVLKRFAIQAKAQLDGVEKPTAFFPMPGVESQWKYRETGHNKTLNIIKREVRELVRAIESLDHLVVYTYKYAPREYLIEMVGACIKNSLCNCISASSGRHNIQRPSLALASFMDVVSSWQHVASSSRIDLNLIVKEVLANEFNDETVGEPGKEFKAAAEEERKQNTPAVTLICDWYKAYFKDDLSKIGAAYSPTVRAFVGVKSEQSEEDSAEIPFGEHTDPTELQSLCILMGPQGIRALDRAMLTIVGENVTIIRDKLEKNAVVLNSFQGPGTELGLWKEIVAKISGFDELMDAAVRMGCVIKFRQLLRAAMGTVLKNDMPFLQQVVAMVTDAIPTVNQAESYFTDINRLAADFGLEVGEADMALSYEMTKHRGNPGTWNLLPAAFGVVFVADRWQKAKYSVRLDGHTNNAHMMVDSLHALIIYMSRASLNDPIQVNDRIQQQSEQFVRMASNSLLHLMGLNANDKRRMKEIRNMMVVLEKFITSTTRLHLSLLDDCFSYTLLRTNYVALYEDEDKSSAYDGLGDSEEKTEGVEPVSTQKPPSDLQPAKA